MKNIENRAETKDWSAAFASRSTSINSATSISPMMQRVGGKVFPVSKHFVYAAYAKCGDKLVEAMKTAAIASDNPAMVGHLMQH